MAQRLLYSPAMRRTTTRNPRRRGGFTLVELMIVVGIIGVFAGIGFLAIQSWSTNQRSKGAARQIGDILLFGRTEAIRTRVPHLVLFSLDADDDPLQNAAGQSFAAVVAADANGDGKPQSGEYVGGVPFDATGSIAWGSAHAAGSGTQAPNDNPAATFPEPDADFACCSFTEPDGDPARWIVFQPDGIPRAYGVGPFAAGGVGTGNGAVYITDGDRDFAVVLSALGAIRVHAFDRGAGTWRQ